MGDIGMPRRRTLRIACPEYKARAEDAGSYYILCNNGRAIKFDDRMIRDQYIVLYCCGGIAERLACQGRQK